MTIIQKGLIFVVGLIAISLFVRPHLTSAAAVEPVVIEGNPKCQDLGFSAGFKPQPEPPSSGTYTFPDGVNTVTISSDGTYFDWSSTIGIDAVIVKGGPRANVYYYDPESFGDTGLNSPVNSSGGPAGISHIDFCYDQDLQVSKTANTSFTRTHLWSIDKSVTPDTWNLFTGQSGTSQYTITVSRIGYVDGDWAVNGAISIHNPTTSSVIITDVSDSIEGIAAPVSCGVTFPYTLPPFQTLTCSYSTGLPDGASRVNTATVNTTNPANSVTATAAVVFGEPSTEVNSSVTVTDTFAGDLGTFSDSGTVTYTRTFTCDQDQGTHDNTATIVETGQSDSASVVVNCAAGSELVVAKTANASFTRTYQWSIDKTVTPDTWNMFTGDTGTSQYDVTASITGYTDSGWAASGTITIYNPTPEAAIIIGIDDRVDGLEANIDCGVTFPYTLPPFQTLTCTYSVELPDGTDRVNTAAVMTIGPVPGGTATADVNFGNPTTEVNSTVTVSDSAMGDLGTFTDGQSVSYTRSFTCDADAGVHDNTAAITETGQSASASVTVNCYRLTVTKDATTLRSRTYTWTIDKSADQTSLTLGIGQVFHAVNYSVRVDSSFTDVFRAGGTITVFNPAPVAATVLGIADQVDGFEASIDCGVSFPFELAAGGTLVCSYSVELPDGATRTNTASATLQNFSYDPSGNGTPVGETQFLGTATVDFTNAQMEVVDECVDVTDTFAGSLGTVCAGGVLPATFTYARDIGPYDSCGTFEVANLASFATSDTGASGYDSWTVVVMVPCAGSGCTLTPGYWKTHSKYGPAPFDDTWALIGEDTPFFNSGTTWYGALWTSPRGKAYWILAHAYIAAYLNSLNGADTSAVAADLAQAELLLSTYTPASQLSGSVRSLFNSTANVLDQYNNGLVGPGHCQ